MAKVFGAGVTSVNFILFVVIFVISNLVAANIQKSEQYELFSDLPDISSAMNIGKIREKRQAVPVSSQNNQYQSITQNGTVTDPAEMPKLQNTTGVVLDPSIVVNYNETKHRLLGENGTGQRRTPLDSATNQPTVIATTDVQGRKLGAVLGVAETSAEQYADKVDVPENETVSELEKEGWTVNQTTDYHSYYNSTSYINKDETAQIWEAIHNSSHNAMLSQAHRRAMTVGLTFDFPFYGHPVRNITVATGGFLYTGEYVHSWLAATQYIAPLMANFDTSISNDSFVRLNDNGTAFTVLWENVSLQDKPDVGKFTFSTTLHKNGDIVFTYFRVPILVNSIQDDKHPVKVGVSDAYIIDKIVFFARRKTIYEYHRVSFGSVDITNATIIRLVALPTCLSYTDCHSCIEQQMTFDCAWCPIVNRCSSGTDRGKQEWVHRGCDRMQITDTANCPILGSKGNNAANSNANSTDYTSPAGGANTNSNSNNKNFHIHDNDKAHDASEEHEDHSDENFPSLVSPNHTGKGSMAAAAVSKTSAASASEMHAEPGEHKSMGVAMGIFVPIALVSSMLVWVIYAYRNPHTKSGQLLIQYRPSTWSWRRGEARYTAATIHM